MVTLDSFISFFLSPFHLKMLNVDKRKGIFIFLLVTSIILYIVSSWDNSTVSNDNDLLQKVNKQKQQLEKETSTLEKDILNKKILPVVYPDPFEFHNVSSPKEKFITYLPHSGFHNQRIELENALLLASYLNRTLLLPSVYLGNPAFPWLRFDKMYERLLLQTKNGLDYCSQIRADEPFPTECLNYPRWTTVPWTFFYDFNKIRQRIRIVFRPDLSLEWIKDSLNVKSEDIYLFKDHSPFDFRVYDLPESNTPLSRFVNRVDISTLEAIEERVIHFGSVFGSYRVLAQSQQNRELLKWVRKNMIFSHPTLVDTATRIVSQLGDFVGIHLRVGDGLFKVRASIHVDDIFHKLVNDYTDLTKQDLLEKYDVDHDQDRKENQEYEIRKLRSEEDEAVNTFEKPITVEHPTDINSRLGPSSSPLCKSNDRFARTTIYIATDCPNPREHPLLRKLFQVFPCIFVLSDFKQELTELAKIQVIDEKVKLQSYLIPMVDAMIASQGHTFYGTNSSTFSTYIERQLHPVYTNQPIELLGAPLP